MRISGKGESKITLGSGVCRVKRVTELSNTVLGLKKEALPANNGAFEQFSMGHNRSVLKMGALWACKCYVSKDG